MRNRGILLTVLAMALLLGVSPLKADNVIQRGIDIFTTAADGKTYYDFSKTPIPAGFFCKSSPAFTGRITFKGLPIETGSPGQLHGTDTVIERLDDAVFDSTGTAVTRIQFRALSLVSVAPVKTACGSFHAYVTLAGKQHETLMRIIRTSDAGGEFLAPLAVNARLTFIPVKPPHGRRAQKLEITTSFTFPASPIPWSTTGRPNAKRGAVLVDTDGDLVPETTLFSNTGFAPGWTPGRAVKAGSCSLCEEGTCHTDPATLKQHCTADKYACYPYNCP